jgi:hypothetical protein
MSTMTIHEVRLTPTRVSRPAARRVERPSTVRLTRRGRVTVLLLGLALALAGGIFLGAGSAATERPGAESTRVVQVGTGDTLWEIAADAAAATGEDDVRAMVDRIESLNALESGMVLAGQRLRVPTD